MGYFLRKKIEKHFSRRSESQYTFADKILLMYIDGELLPLLRQYGFKNIDICPEFYTIDNLELQVSFLYSEIGCGIGFMDDVISVTLRTQNDPWDADDTVEMEYPENFDLKTFFDDVLLKIKDMCAVN